MKVWLFALYLTCRVAIYMNFIQILEWIFDDQKIYNVLWEDRKKQNSKLLLKMSNKYLHFIYNCYYDVANGWDCRNISNQIRSIASGATPFKSSDKKENLWTILAPWNMQHIFLLL